MSRCASPEGGRGGISNETRARVSRIRRIEQAAFTASLPGRADVIFIFARRAAPRRRSARSRSYRSEIQTDSERLLSRWRRTGRIASMRPLFLRNWYSAAAILLQFRKRSISYFICDGCAHARAHSRRTAWSDATGTDARARDSQ